MRILMLNHNRMWEGTFNRAFQFGRALARKGHHVMIVTVSRNRLFSFKEERCDNLTIVESPDLLFGKLRNGWGIFNALRRILYLRSAQFDIINAFDCRPSVIYPALYLKRKLGVPLVIDWADWWGRGGAVDLRKNRVLNKLFEPVETYFEENFRKYADYITVISDMLKERASDLASDPTRIKVILSGSDVNGMKVLDKESARKTLGIPRESNVLIYSEFAGYDVDLVLETYKRVLEKRPGTYLVITGMKPMVKKGNAGSRLLTPGLVPREKLNLYLAAADMCLLPLRNNLANLARFPGKIGDYMAAGRPIVSNPVGAVSGMILDHDMGIIADGDPESFARGILYALSDEGNLDTWGRNARKAAERYFSFDILATDLEDIYEEVLSKKRSGI